jgi:tripartite-type tricarboxylate transporter receptor subunit TctC
MSTTRRLLLLGTAMLAGLAAFQPGEGLAQDYPSHPITILVPAAAGGPSDTVAWSSRSR